MFTQSRKDAKKTEINLRATRIQNDTFCLEKCNHFAIRPFNSCFCNAELAEIAEVKTSMISTVSALGKLATKLVRVPSRRIGTGKGRTCYYQCPPDLHSPVLFATRKLSGISDFRLGISQHSREAKSAVRNPQSQIDSGCAGRIRTSDPRFMRPLLFRLSYAAREVWDLGFGIEIRIPKSQPQIAVSTRWDSNPRNTSLKRRVP